MKALWWWIDRWQGSSAYKDMTLEEQGAYRNLLDECWLRDGALPADERLLSRFCGDPTAWARVRPAVMARFALDVTANEWRHPTLDKVLRESKRKAKNQAKYRAGLTRRTDRSVGHVADNVTGNGPGNTGGHFARSLDPAEEESGIRGAAAGRGVEPPAAAQEGRVGSGVVLPGGKRHPRGACADPTCCEQLPAREVARG